MNRIGIIIDRYHLQKKVTEFLKYLQKIAKITLYVEELHLLDFKEVDFKEDIFFVKAKGDLVLSLTKLIEKETNIPVINTSRSIWLAFNRFLNSTLLRKAGVLVPDFSINPLNTLPRFRNFIAKNAIDQKNYVFKPSKNNLNDGFRIYDERALSEAKQGGYISHFLYYQQFIESEWEYKVYRIGDDLFYYKQIPVLKNPKKLKSRVQIDPINELTETAFKATDTIGLKISSMDFQKSKEGDFYLTDINSSPNFNYLKRGPEIVGEFLIQEAKR